MFDTRSRTRSQIGHRRHCGIVPLFSLSISGRWRPNIPSRLPLVPNGSNTSTFRHPFTIQSKREGEASLHSRYPRSSSSEKSLYSPATSLISSRSLSDSRLYQALHLPSCLLSSRVKDFGIRKDHNRLSSATPRSLTLPHAGQRDKATPSSRSHVTPTISGRRSGWRTFMKQERGGSTLGSASSARMSSRSAIARRMRIAC